MLGMNSSTARTRYARARHRLAAELTEHGEATSDPKAVSDTRPRSSAAEPDSAASSLDIRL